MFATTASATSKAGEAKLRDLQLRTGDNSASTEAGIRNMQREAQQTADAGLNRQYSEDYGRNLDWQTALLNADLVIPLTELQRRAAMPHSTI